MQFIDKTPAEISTIVAEFRRGRKVTLSNFFGAVEGEYGIYESENSLLIRKKELDFYRAYLISSDIHESEIILNELQNQFYIFNIPSKGSIDDWQDLFNKTGYELYGIYNRYYNMKIKARKSAKGEYALIDDVDKLEEILTSNFSKYTDYIPTKAQLKDMIHNQQVLVSRDDNGEVQGTLIYTLEGKKCYFNVWIDRSGNGLFLLYKAYNIVVQHNIGYVYFWVNSINHDVIRLHEMMGAIHDGLVDYTFIKLTK